MKRIHLLKPGTFRDMSGQEVRLSAADLAACAAAYDPAVHEAPLVIGHPQHDMPAYGWLAKASNDGNGLHGEPQQVDESLISLIGAGRVKKISTSLWPPNHPDNPRPGVYYIKHVGFLGAAAPAVKGLKQVQLAGVNDGCLVVELAAGDAWTVGSLFRALRDWLISEKGKDAADAVLPDAAVSSLQSAAAFEAGQACGDDSDDATVMLAASDAARRQQFAGPNHTFPIAGADDVGKAWNLAGKASDPDAVRKQIIQIAREHGWLAGLPDTARAWAKDHAISLSEPSMPPEINLAEQQSALMQQKADLDAREARIKQAETAVRRADVVAFVGGLVGAAKVHPREQNFLIELAMALDPVQTIKFSEGEGKAAANANMLERFKTFLTGLAPVVELSERAGGAAPKAGTIAFSSPEGLQVDRGGLETHAKAQAYMAQHNVSYVEAVQAVSG